MSSLRPGTRIEAVPIFPLPHMVLFPGAVLPLHVFEPRYRALTTDALAADKLICMANVSGSSDDSNTIATPGQPPVARVAGVGEIVDHEQLPDGRYHLLLLGRARVSVDELQFRPPYRRAHLTVLASQGHEPNSSDRAALRAAIQRQVQTVRANHPEFEFDYPASLPTPQLIDLCSHYLVADGHHRQVLLETLDIEQRLARCLQVLMDQGKTSPPDYN